MLVNRNTDISKLGEVKNYRKKPIVISAVRLNQEVEIKTLEGVMTGKVGDYLIVGISGEVYPCKPDIFRKTYEEVPNFL